MSYPCLIYGFTTNVQHTKTKETKHKQLMRLEITRSLLKFFFFFNFQRVHIRIKEGGVEGFGRPPEINSTIFKF